MEKKIDEIFNLNGVHVKVAESIFGHCHTPEGACAGLKMDCIQIHAKYSECDSDKRTDGKFAVFLEVKDEDKNYKIES